MQRITPALGGRRIGVVLVHGACHGSWCWENVVDPVRSAGLEVHAVDLPLTSLSNDADVVRSAVRAMKESCEAVLVVGHSYGGVVITAGGHEADALMYCAASMPDAGQAASDVVPQLTTPELESSLAVHEDGVTFGLDPVRAVPAFYGMCTAAQIKDVLGRLRPMHFACMNEAIVEPAWRSVPSSYVVCTEDLAMAPAYQEGRANFLGDAVRLRCDHSLFYSAPDQLVARLVEVASAGRRCGHGESAGHDTRLLRPGTADLHRSSGGRLPRHVRGRPQRANGLRHASSG